MNKNLGLNPWFSVWTKPRTTIRALVAYDVNYQFVVLCVLYGLQYILHLLQFGGSANSLGSVLLTAVILATPIGYIVFNLETVIFFLIGKLIKGGGRFKQIRAAICWSNIPIVCNLAIWVILLLIYGNDLFITSSYQRLTRIDMVINIIIAVAQIIFIIWSLILLVHVLSEVQGFSAWMALLNIILSGIVVFILVLLANWAISIIKHVS